MERSQMYWQTYLNLESELLDVSKYIEITDTTTVGNNGEMQSCYSQLETFSSHIADLLVRTCIEIEAISKELYYNNGGTKQRGDHVLFDEDCIKHLDIIWGVHSKAVLVVSPRFSLFDEKNLVLYPLKNAHKKQGTDWERAYQAVKHDRYGSIHKGTVKNLIRSMAALYLLNVYNREEKFSVKYNELNSLDMSMGSKVFSLQKPEQKYLNDTVNGKKNTGILRSSDSPYVAKYTDDCYRKTLDAYEYGVNAMNKYLALQPELKEPEFIEQIKEKEKSGNRVLYFWELGQYRLDKKIPKSLPFEERKALLLQSDEWNLPINLKNEHIDESELNEMNIQSAIDTAGTRAGMALQCQFEYHRIDMGLNNGECDVVLDKGKVRYPTR